MINAQHLASPLMRGLLDNYDTPDFFCELMNRNASVPPIINCVKERLSALSIEELKNRTASAEAQLYRMGITFTVYTDKEAIDRILPFDAIPRIITGEEWKHIERGVEQRIQAINLFLHDIYHEQHILKDGVVPSELVLTNPNYCQAMIGLSVPGGVYVHINGTDLIRDQQGRFLVLEDNARTPSGVSYVIENRHMMLRLMPDLASGLPIRSVENYGPRLHQVLCEVAPDGVADPQVVLLSPGIYNSAYFEHVFLSREMGIPLVEGKDLFVDNHRVFMRTVMGPRPVHSIYRRLNDDFLDPLVFNPNSLLGVPGLVEAYRQGNVTLANALGTGVADDKAVYAYMPRIIRYYLNEDPILESVETHICAEPEGLAYTLANLNKLVVKPVGESGGYGLLIGPQATRAELDEFSQKLQQNPKNYISQPTIGLSVTPTLCGNSVEARHVDLRPFAVTGRSVWVLPGGLSRVALRKGSLVVNSSQGGGSKDTWVMAS
ncbi:circularly permuted type 2 ATP-grasp protein [Acetobacter syzygii]|uniref:circularly permuted type 2 ATP-grasp protein n=1 Tax=Acetobacter syzygii TaxID=146476 RepID=UPI0039E9A7A3